MRRFINSKIEICIKILLLLQPLCAEDENGLKIVGWAWVYIPLSDTLDRFIQCIFSRFYYKVIWRKISKYTHPYFVLLPIFHYLILKKKMKKEFKIFYFIKIRNFYCIATAIVNSFFWFRIKTLQFFLCSHILHFLKVESDTIKVLRDSHNVLLLTGQ